MKTVQTGSFLNSTARTIGEAVQTSILRARMRIRNYLSRSLPLDSGLIPVHEQSTYPRTGMPTELTLAIRPHPTMSLLMAVEETGGSGGSGNIGGSDPIHNVKPPFPLNRDEADPEALRMVEERIDFLRKFEAFPDIQVSPFNLLLSAFSGGMKGTAHDFKTRTDVKGLYQNFELDVIGNALHFLCLEKYLSRRLSKGRYVYQKNHQLDELLSTQEMTSLINAIKNSEDLLELSQHVKRLVVSGLRISNAAFYLLDSKEETAYRVWTTQGGEPWDDRHWKPQKPLYRALTLQESIYRANLSDHLTDPIFDRYSIRNDEDTYITTPRMEKAFVGCPIGVRKKDGESERNLGACLILSELTHKDLVPPDLLGRYRNPPLFNPFFFTGPRFNDTFLASPERAALNQLGLMIGRRIADLSEEAGVKATWLSEDQERKKKEELATS